MHIHSHISGTRSTAFAATLGLLVAIAAGQAPQPAHAQADGPEIEPRFALRLGAMHTDNLGRSQSNQATESATFATLGVDVGVARRTQRLYAYADGTMDYHHYDHDVYRNETLGRLRGGLDVSLVPDRFVWEFSGNVGDRRRDPFRASAPDNRERLAVYSTGPSVRMPLGARHSFAFNARHAERRWQDSSQLDSTAQSADMSLFRALSPIHNIGVTGSARRIEYDVPFLPRRDVESLFVTYSRTLSDGSLDASAGTNRLKYLDSTRSSPYVALNWNRRIAAYSSIAVFGSRRFEDTADRLRRRPVGPGGIDDFDDIDDLDGIGQVPIAGNPLTRTTAGFAYELDRDRAIYTFGTDWFQQRFVDAQQLDRDGWRSRVRASYSFSRATSGHIGVGYGRERYTGAAGSASSRRTEIGLDRLLSRTWSLTFRYRYESRQRAAGREYSENRYTVAMVWAPGR